MKKVYKYNVPEKDLFSIIMPEHEVLSVQVQHNNIFMWVVVDTETKEKIYHFRLCGTGHELRITKYDYIGTVQLYEGDLVLHLFEIKE